jgi:hypothetical protein
MAGDRVRVATPHVIHESIDGETIIINLDSGTYYSTKGSGAQIWEAIQGAPGVRVSDLADAVAQSHVAASTDVPTAVQEFVTQLRDEGLVVSVEGDLPAAETPPISPADTQFLAPTLEKYTDMQDLVLLDPVHQVDETGWPAARADVAGPA